MEPPGPQDAETRTIIDKLAEFVARNGPDFEAMTKKKQLTNPKFGFLYGGEHYNYYKHRVCMEQRLLEQQYQPALCSPMGNPRANLVNLINPQSQLFNMDLPMNGQGTGCPPPPIPPNLPPNMNAAPPPGNPTMIGMQIESLNVQQNTLREQFCQSEQNLQAQHTALMQQQQQKIDEMLPTTQKEYLQKTAKEESIDLAAYDLVLQPIIDSCTKDSISAGKSWILQSCSDANKSKVVLQYLLQKALDAGDKFASKLHLIYLVNDVLHHCARKNVDDLKNGLENIVIPMFCSAQLIASEAEGLKLTKLLSLWESKGNFFDACVISKLRCPESSIKEYHTNLAATHSQAVNSLKQSTKTTFDNYQQQHQAFMKHATQQITTWENQKQSLEKQLAMMTAPPISNLLQSPPPVFMGGPGPNNVSPMDAQQPVNMMPPMGGPGNGPPNMENLLHHHQPHHNQQNQQPSSIQSNENYSQPPPNNFRIPDFSRPPPGFGAPPMQDGPPVTMAPAAIPPQEIIPATPYFDLPAGLMAPFIRLEDCSYKALDPKLIVLPPPTPPSERLLMAVESFYSLPSHDRPRDGDGWEKLALYEYYKVKNQAKKQKEEAIQKGLRDRSRSPSPVTIDTRAKKANKRRYRSESRSPVRTTVAAIPPVVTSTPPLQDEMDTGRGSRGGSGRGGRHSHSRDKRSDSPAAFDSNRSGERTERLSRGRHREMSPPNVPTIGFNKSNNNSIDETNKGHQMLLKMGWAGTGTGLGASGQGIDKPIDGGAVRDRQDVYKGVGMNLNDPYENFRKNKGAAFITRMKARTDDKV